MSTINPSSLLSMRANILGQNEALQRAAGAQQPGDAAATGFGEVMVDALRTVNAQQAKASALSADFERGTTQDIVQVMIERQKASLGFEATLQVRNKLLSAYRDVMNMPV